MSAEPSEVEDLRLLLSALTCRVSSAEERLENCERRLALVEGQGRPSGDPDFEVVEGSSSNEVGVNDSAGRRRLAEQIGGFLRRCIRHEPRGSSGRDRLRLQNRLWVVIAGFDGRVLPQPRAEFSFALVRELCKIGSDPGRSIFVGFATQWEARIALEAAGLVIPANLQDG